MIALVTYIQVVLIAARAPAVPPSTVVLQAVAQCTSSKLMCIISCALVTECGDHNTVKLQHACQLVMSLALLLFGCCCFALTWMHCVLRLANQQMGAVLICWRQQVQRQHRTKRLVAQRVQQTKLELLYAVVTQWHQLAQTQHRKAAIIARCQRSHDLHLLQQGVLALSSALVVGKTRRSVLEVVSSKAKVSCASILCSSITVALPLI